MTPSPAAPSRSPLRIDAHVHLWDPGHLRYAWLDGNPVLGRPFLPADWGRAAQGTGLEGMVFVQCDCAPDQSLAEAAWVSDLATRDARLIGIVAHAAVERAEGLDAHLDRLAALPLVRGVRRLLQDERAPGFCSSPAMVAGVRRLARHGFTFDICIRHHQLADATRLVAAVPEVTFILDHLGKPDIRGRQLDPWRADLVQLAMLPNVVCKISGLASEAAADYASADLRPYVEHALSVFGPRRCLFGSDWPVVEEAGGYARFHAALASLFAPLPAADRAAVEGGNARRIYRLQ